MSLKAERLGEWHRGCPAEEFKQVCGRCHSKKKGWENGIEDVQRQLSNYQKHKSGDDGALSNPKTSYFNSETSCLHWKSKLRNVGDSKTRFCSVGMGELLHSGTYLRGVCHQGKSQSICAALFNAIREVFLLACCCFLYLCWGQVARCQSIMQILHAMLPLSKKCFNKLA